MTLKSYYEQFVIIIANGQTYIGYVTDYFYPEDNEDGEESIIVKTDSGKLIEFTNEVIEQINLI